MPCVIVEFRAANGMADIAYSKNIQQQEAEEARYGKMMGTKFSHGTKLYR